MKTVMVALVAGLLAIGCTTPLNTFGLNAEQLAAAAKVKDANVLCVEADVMLGANKGSLVIASVDKGMTAAISVDARGKCAVEMRVDPGK